MSFFSLRFSFDKTNKKNNKANDRQLLEEKEILDYLIDIFEMNSLTRRLYTVEEYILHKQIYHSDNVNLVID